MKCCDLTAGMLRHIVEFQNPPAIADGQGGVEGSWTTHASNVRGALRPVSGNERYFGQQLESAVTHHFFMRYRNDITAKQRLVYEGRNFQVRAVIDIEERKQWLDLLVEEGVAT
jgi:SPP1 family predicted phage head-tail adaptor